MKYKKLEDEKIFQNKVAIITMENFGKEVAKESIWLSSDASSFFIGSDIAVDEGWIAP